MAFAILYLKTHSPTTPPPLKYPIFTTFIVMDLDYPLDMTRKQALIRRANMLLVQIQRDYLIFTDEASVNALYEFSKRIVWALEESIPQEEFREFLLLFQEARKMLKVKEGEDQEAAYNECLASLISSLERYRGHIEDMEE